MSIGSSSASARDRTRRENAPRPGRTADGRIRDRTLAESEAEDALVLPHACKGGKGQTQALASPSCGHIGCRFDLLACVVASSRSSSSAQALP